MRRFVHAALAMMVCFMLPSCSSIGKAVRKIPMKLPLKMPWKKKKTEAAKNDDTVHIIGFIELVNPEQRFVLIRTQGRLAIPAGREITAMDASGGSAKLKVSPEKKQDFLIADIVDGAPHAGNVVLFKPDKRAVPPADPTPPATPAFPPPPLPIEPSFQPMPLSPVAPSEFTRAGGNLPLTPSPIPPQTLPSEIPRETIPSPGQIQLPPVVR